jgi:CHAT domain-containing protein
MAFLLNSYELPLDAMPFSEGLLGNFPHLGQFPEGFLAHRAACEKVLQQAQARTDDGCLDQALFDLGVVLMLQGELVSAVNLLLEAAVRAKNDNPTLRVLALSYAVHCRAMQYTWSPGGTTLISDEISRTFDYKQRIPPMQEEIRDAKRHTGYDARCEAVEISITTQRDFVHARPVTPTSENLALTKRVALPQLEATIARLANNIGADLLTAMQIELAWLYRVVGSPSKFLSTLHAAKDRVQDQSALAAHVEMRVGDDHCTFYGYPETWDTNLERGTESNAQPRDEETIHFMDGATRNTTLARSHYERAQDIFQDLGLLRGIAAIQLRLGYIAILGDSRNHTPADRYKEALEHVLLAENLYSCCGDSVGVQVARAHSCLCRVGIGEEPEDHDSARSIGNWGRKTGSYSFAFGLGLFFAKYARRWLVAVGDYERAVAAHKLAETLFDALDAKLPRLFSITDQMAIYESLGERDRFMVTAEHALDLCANLQKSPDASIANKAFNHGANVFSRMCLWAQKHADPDEISSVASRMKAMKEDFEEMHGRDTIASMKDLAQEYSDMPVLTLQELLKDHDEQSGAGSHTPDLGTLLEKMKSFDIDPLEFQTKGSLVMINHMISNANFLAPFYRGRKAAREGDHRTAETLWRQAEAYLEEHENEQKDVLLALLYTDMEKDDKALLHIKAYSAKREAEHRNRPVGRTSEDETLMDRSYWQAKLEVLRMFARSGHFEEAWRYLKVVQDQWGEDWWKTYEENVWENLSLLGQINAGLQDDEVACYHYEQAMQAFEERRDQLSIDDYKIALAGNSNVQEIYFGAARSAVRLHTRSQATTNAGAMDIQLQRAFVNLERGKSRSLLDLVGVSALMNKSSPLQPQEQWSQYKKQMALLTTRRALLANAYSSTRSSDTSYMEHLRADVAAREQQVRAIAKDLTESAQTRTAPVLASETIDLPETCSLLAEDTGVLQYSYQRNDLIAWLITKRGMIEVHHIEIPEAELERNVHNFLRACEGATSNADHLASWLGEKLLPFKSLPELKRLIIVAYRALHLVPFHALPSEQGLLFNNHSVSYLPSTSLLKHLGHWKELNSSINVLAIGDPSNMVYKDPISGIEEFMPSLPGSALEAEEIAKIVPGSMALIGAAATSEAVYSQMTDHTVLHFGTHGSLFATIPMLSAVHLAGGTQITVDQLMGRHLKAELVVLSACNTGRGKVTEGEDVIGFARVLFAAGVKHIIVSLWPVDDMATCYLMIQMYKNVMRGMSLAEALRGAQAALRGSKKEEVDTYVGCLPTGKRILETCAGRSIARDYSRKDELIVGSYSNPKFWAPFVLLSA